MQFLKRKIRNCFNKSSKTYDYHCRVQKLAAIKAIEILTTLKPNCRIVADFACGTGISTLPIMHYLQPETIYAIDFSENLLAMAARRLKINNIKFILSDFDNILFLENYLDLVFCNMGLQWSLNIANTLKLFNFYLKESLGLLVFSMPIQGTFPEIHDCYKNPYLKPLDIEKVLENSGFSLLQFHPLIYVDHFISQLDAILSLKAVGANCLFSQANKSRTPGLKGCIKYIFKNSTDTSLTYHIGIFVAQKMRKKS